MVAVGSGFCPQADAAQQATSKQRYEVIERSFRESKPAPIPLLTAEAAWTLKLNVPPSAGGAMDEDRVYIPLREELFVAIERETGLLAWMREIETTAPPVVGGGHLFVVSRGHIQAVDAATGEELWSVAVDTPVTAPLTWDNGWLIALVEPG